MLSGIPGKQPGLFLCCIPLNPITPPNFSRYQNIPGENFSMQYIECMLWRCPIKFPMVFDQCALPRGVTWRDPARHVTCPVQPIGGPFHECGWEGCACGMGTQFVCKLLPPISLSCSQGSVLPLSVLWCCINMVTFYLICNLSRIQCSALFDVT